MLNPAQKLIDVYVVWRTDGPTHTTLLQFEDSDMQRQAMQDWATKDYVTQAIDAEYPGEPNQVSQGGASFEVIAIFEAPSVRFIY